MGYAFLFGMKRALFSNEAGQGSAPIAHAAAKTDEPVREGTVAMIGPFIDTLMICTMTGLVIILTDAWTVTDAAGQALNGSPMTSYAFQTALAPILGPYSKYLVTTAVFLFAISTAISWSYYGGRAVTYLFGTRYVIIYRLISVVAFFLAAVFFAAFFFVTFFFATFFLTTFPVVEVAAGDSVAGAAAGWPLSLPLEFSWSDMITA